jgi:hypothetical protein
MREPWNILQYNDGQTNYSSKGEDHKVIEWVLVIHTRSNNQTVDNKLSQPEKEQIATSNPAVVMLEMMKDGRERVGQVWAQNAKDASKIDCSL